MMARRVKRSRFRRWLPSMVLGVLVVAGCNSGGIGDTPPPPPRPDMDGGDMMEAADMAEPPRPSQCVVDGKRIEGEWRPNVAQVTVGAADGCATAVGDDQVWFIAGRDQGGTPSSDVQILDLRTLVVRTGVSLPYALTNISCAQYRGEILAIGGESGVVQQKTVLVFQGDHWDRWKCRPNGLGGTICDSMLDVRSRSQSTTVPAAGDDYLCTGGGAGGTGPTAAECQNPPPYTIAPVTLHNYHLPTFNVGRIGTATAFWNGRFCVMGGEARGAGMPMDGTLLGDIQCLTTVLRNPMTGGTLGVWEASTRPLPIKSRNVLAGTFSVGPDESLYEFADGRLFELRPPPNLAPEEKSPLPGDSGIVGSRRPFARVREGFIAASHDGHVSLWCPGDP